MMRVYVDIERLVFVGIERAARVEIREQIERELMHRMSDRTAVAHLIKSRRLESLHLDAVGKSRHVDASGQGSSA